MEILVACDSQRTRLRQIVPLDLSLFKLNLRDGFLSLYGWMMNFGLLYILEINHALNRFSSVLKYQQKDRS